MWVELPPRKKLREQCPDKHWKSSILIDLTCNNVDDGAQLVEYWATIGDVRMTSGDKADLGPRSHSWLNDRHMTAAQILLKCAHSDVAGLQAPTLQCTRTFEVHQERQFVQILNLSKSHWITISTLNCQPGTVHVYDSMQLGLNSSLKRIVADLMFYKGKKITIKYMHIQQQKGASDCGLFAIATATARNWAKQIAIRSKAHETTFKESYWATKPWTFPSYPCGKKTSCNNGWVYAHILYMSTYTKQSCYDRVHELRGMVSYRLC